MTDPDAVGRLVEIYGSDVVPVELIANERVATRPAEDDPGTNREREAGHAEYRAGMPDDAVIHALANQPGLSSRTAAKYSNTATGG